MNLDEYCSAFEEARVGFEQAVLAYGLPFEPTETQARSARERTACDHCENGGASLWSGWISPACIACRTGEKTATFFISLKCTRSCYFCFNVNQEDYEHYRAHERDIEAELRSAHAAGASFRHLAVTGGEPCLHPDALIAFVRCAKELYPGVHVRLYTSGDRLDDALLGELSQAGLDEIRFSVKPEESREAREETLNRIAAAVRFIPDVMVEMPVIPGTLGDMKDLLLALDASGVRGINLLEFCFPLANAEAFLSRGFELRRNPYVIPYNYWYAGGLPIAGSEAVCLELMRFASQRALRIGVHYCSLDNKHSGQIYQQNKPFLLDPAFAGRYPHLAFDRSDYFLKCAKVFGEDAKRVLGVLESMAIDGAGASGGYRIEEDVPSAAFPVSWMEAVSAKLPSLDIGVSFNVLEWDQDGVRVREVAVKRA